MANAIQCVLDSGITAYAIILNSVAEIYDANLDSFVTIDGDDWADYAVSLTESVAGMYFADLDPSSNWGAGIYNCFVYKQLGVSPATTDLFIGSERIDWIGEGNGVNYLERLRSILDSMNDRIPGELDENGYMYCNAMLIAGEFPSSFPFKSAGFMSYDGAVEIVYRAAQIPIGGSGVNTIIANSDFGDVDDVWNGNILTSNGWCALITDYDGTTYTFTLDRIIPLFLEEQYFMILPFHDMFTSISDTVDANIVSSDDIDFTDTQKASLTTAIVTGVPTAYAPTSVVKNAGGTLTGNHVQLASHDDVPTTLAETAPGGAGLSLDVILSASATTKVPSLVRVTGYYNGSTSHEVYIQAYNYTTSGWETAATMRSRASAFDYVVPLSVNNHDPSTGEMQLRFLHNTTTYNGSHLLTLDWVSWEKIETNSQLSADVAAIYTLLQDVDNEVDIIEEIVDGFETNGINITSDSITDIAEEILKLDWTTVSGEAARSTLNALRILRNKWIVDELGIMSVKKEDDSTEAWNSELSSSASANPVIGSDPT